VENIQENGALVHILNVFDLLGNVLRGGTNTTNRQEDIILQEVASEHLDVAWESGGEHESLTALDAWHILALNNATNLWLETHVQHTISLIENKVLDVLEGNAATLNQVDKTTWSGNEEIASTLDLAKLRSNIGTTVNNAWSDPRSVGELTGLFVNLRDQLTGWCKDEGCRVCLALASKAGTSASWRWGWTVDESLGQDWEQETSSLSGTSLGTSHQITPTHDNWDGVLLDWCWDLVVSKLNVANEMVVQWWVGELEDWLWDIVSGSLDWDIVVLLEVDTSLLLGWVIGDAKELTLNTWVCWSGDVLAIFPLSITATASDGRASGGSSRVPVCVGIESSRGAGILPSATTTRWRSTTRSEGRSISPVSAWARSIGSEAVGSTKFSC